MTSAASHPHLRFVDHGDDFDQKSRLAIIKENRIAAHAPGLWPGFAAGIDASDPRWVLAMQTQSRLQGTILTPARRDQLLRNGAKLGLRPFEANLVIAIVQDRARSGLAADQSGPTLALVGRGGEGKPAAPSWPRWLVVIAAACVLAALMIRWLTG